jgi:hypothetical protein
MLCGRVGCIGTLSGPTDRIGPSEYGSVSELIAVAEEVRSSLISWTEASERGMVDLCS